MTAPEIELSSGEKVARGADRTLTVVLIVAQVLVSLAVGGLSLLLVMVTDSCGVNGDDPLVCSTGGIVLFLVAIGVEWLLLVGGVVFSIVRAVRAARRQQRSWPWPLVGTGIGVLGVVLLVASVFSMTR